MEQYEGSAKDIRNPSLDRPLLAPRYRQGYMGLVILVELNILPSMMIEPGEGY